MKKRIISLILSLLLVTGLVPVTAMTILAEDSYEGEVRVIISNDTYPMAHGAPWEGVLVDEWVMIDSGSTMMSCVLTALDNKDYEQIGAENNYISEINGLAEFDGGEMSGWMGVINDRPISCGFGDISVAKGDLTDGDEIHIMYSCEMGEDPDPGHDNVDSRISSIIFSEGVLDKEFDPEHTYDFGAYTLTLPAGADKVKIQPTATDQSLPVRIFLNAFEEGDPMHSGDYEYSCNDDIPVKNGDVIYVGCACAGWSGGSASDDGHVYAFNIVIPGDDPEKDKETDPEKDKESKPETSRESKTQTGLKNRYMSSFVSGPSGKMTSRASDGISFSATVLYTGDDIDLIPASKTAVAVAVTGIPMGSRITYNDGTDEFIMFYSEAVSEKTGVSTYITIVPSETALGGFIKEANYIFETEEAEKAEETEKAEEAEELIFGDCNGDGVINAQDALNIVNCWRKNNEDMKDKEILINNVNGDSRINTSDAQEIIEYFVNGSEFGVISHAAAVKNAEK